MAFAGIAMMTASAWIMLLIPVLLLLLDRGVVRREERYLAGRFGPEYLAYTRRVRRRV